MSYVPKTGYEEIFSNLSELKTFLDTLEPEELNALPDEHDYYEFDLYIYTGRNYFAFRGRNGE